MKLMTVVTAVCMTLAVPALCGSQKLSDIADKAQTTLELIGQKDNIEQIGWQAMLAGKMLPACRYFSTKIALSEADILSNSTLFGANQTCCKTRELSLTALAAFIFENAKLLEGTKASEGSQKLADILADQAGSGNLADEMKGKARESTLALIQQCSIVAGAYEATQKQ